MISVLIKIMSAAPKNDPGNEIFVRREDFDRYFSKPIPRATFFRWVDQGKIKKARDLDGWYKLNATLVYQGLQPVDVSALQEKRKAVDKRLKNRQLLYLAAKAADPLYGQNLPKYFEEPETLTEKEVEMIEDLKRQIIKSADFVCEHPLEYSAYRIGLLSALEHSAYLDSLEG